MSRAEEVRLLPRSKLRQNPHPFVFLVLKDLVPEEEEVVLVVSAVAELLFSLFYSVQLPHTQTRLARAGRSFGLWMSYQRHALLPDELEDPV